MTRRVNMNPVITVGAAISLACEVLEETPAAKKHPLYAETMKMLDEAWEYMEAAINHGKKVGMRQALFPKKAISMGLKERYGPLRKIVKRMPSEVHYLLRDEVLECGHKQRVKEDIHGLRNDTTLKRRCSQCRDEGRD